MKSLVSFPMKATSKTHSKTIFHFMAASALLVGGSYQVWTQTSAFAFPTSAALSKSKVAAEPPVKSGPSGTVPVTPAPAGGISDKPVPVGAEAPAGGVNTAPQVPSMPGDAATPKEPPTTTKPDGSTPAAEATGDTVVGVASSNQQLKTLTAAIKAAGLEETLAGKGPFTIFAPTDEAFAALPPGVVDALLKPENKEKLAQLLTYHVVSGKVESKTLKSGDVPTLLGQPIAVKVQGKEVNLNGESKVIQADIPASNGVIHLVDKVIIPAG
jgi:uncharacterized surface protein with fasciclin (FAS1) repeats